MGVTQEAGASQFGGDIHSKKGEIQLATCWDYNHVLVFLQFCY